MDHEEKQGEKNDGMILLMNHDHQKQGKKQIPGCGGMMENVSMAETENRHAAPFHS